VGVEKGTKPVISVNFSVSGQRTFNNLRTTFLVEIPEKRGFSTPTPVFVSYVELFYRRGLKTVGRT
jgi:hypothetical protein